MQRIVGGRRKTPGFWLLSRPVTFGSGATGQPRLWTGGEEGEDAWFLWLFVSFCGFAMGSRSSHVALIPDVDQIRRETGFSQASLLRLYHRFQALDREEKGFLSRLDLQQIGALAVNPLGDRIIDSFFPNGSQRVYFAGFARVLAYFRPIDEDDATLRDPKQPEPLNSRMNKLRFAFQLYDLDRDGKISRNEMLQVLRLMVGVQVTDEQLESITDRTVQEADEDGDGAVSFLEFAKSLEKMNIEQKMSIRILK